MMRQLADELRLFCTIAIVTAAFMQVFLNPHEPAIFVTATATAALVITVSRLLRWSRPRPPRA